MRFSTSNSRVLFCAFTLLSFITSLFSNTTANNPGKETYPNTPDFFFIENKGQWDNEIFYKLNMGANRLFLMDGKLTYQLLDPEDLAERSHKHHHGGEYHGHEETVIHGHNFTVDFIGSSKYAKAGATKKLSAYHNYILGDDPSKWAGNVGLYHEVSYENLFEDIDLKFYFSENNLKYDYLVAPKADPSKIIMEYNHADQVFLKDKKLHIVTSVNEVIEQEPYAYQYIGAKKVEVACEFKLKGNQMGFHFPNGYNTNYELVIDPVLIFASYSASSGDNWGMTATFDDQGNLYGGGVAFGNYPTTPGAFDTDDPGFFSTDPGDMGISKFSERGNNLIYSTYVGGRDMDTPHSMVVNSKGELIIFGTTSSRNFPTSNNAYDRTFNGGPRVSTSSALEYENGSDIVVVVLNNAGSGLAGSTYVGGSGNDGLHLMAVGARLNYSDDLRGEVIIDSDDNIYVGSTSYSQDFPVSSNAFDTSNNGDEDAVIFKLNPTASSLLWATYLGGAATEAAFSLKLDADNNPYVVGMTSGSDFPVTPTGLNRDFQRAGGEGFVAHIKNDGQQLLHATFLNRSDFAYFVELDDLGFVYVLGQSSSANYPVSPNTFSNPNSTMFLQKLNPELSNSEFSTLLGNGLRNSGLFVPSAFLVDVCRRIYISGWGGDTNGSDVSGMPISSDAFQSRTDGSDFYLMVLKPDARDLEYGTYFGGGISNEHVDGGTSRFDKKGIIYQAVCAGCGGNSDFPTTPGAHSTRNGSTNCNLGVFKFDFQFGEIVANADVEPDFSGCAPFEINFQNQSTGATMFNWNFGDGNTSSERAPTHTFNDVGTYTIRLIGTIEENCIDPDTIFLNIEAIEPPPGVTSSETICEGDLTNLNSTVTDPNTTYNWSDGSMGSSISVERGGIFWVDSGDSACPQRDSFIIFGIPNGNTTTQIGICEGTERTISSSNMRPDATFEWNDGTRSQSIEIDQTGLYFVMANELGCMSIDSFIVVPDSIILDALVLNIDCVGQDSGFIQGNTLGGVPPYEYSLDNSTFSLNSTFDGLNAGNYVLESRDVNGCRDLINLSVNLPPEVAVDLGGIQQVCLGDSIELVANTNLTLQEISSVVWSGLENPNCSDCLSQFVKPLQNSTYSLVLTSVDGCVDSTTVSVVVDPKRPVYIPSAFTPDNNGINDIFFINARQNVVKSVNRFQIFDRWGELIYQATDFQPNDPTFGWDGYFREKLMNSAVFAWYAEIEFIDGVVELYEGDVTLIR